MYIHPYGDRTACKRHPCILQSNTLAPSNDRDPEENALPKSSPAAFPVYPSDVVLHVVHSAEQPPAFLAL